MARSSPPSIETGAPVAVKLLALHESSVAARFIREATFMARIRHPNVVQIVDFGTLDDETPCIVMERVAGARWRSACAIRERCPWPEAVAMLRAVLDGLDAIHAAGVLHRDLKPANVMEEAETGRSRSSISGSRRRSPLPADALHAIGDDRRHAGLHGPEQFVETPVPA